MFLVQSLSPSHPPLKMTPFTSAFGSIIQKVNITDSETISLTFWFHSSQKTNGFIKEFLLEKETIQIFQLHLSTSSMKTIKNFLKYGCQGRIQSLNSRNWSKKKDGWNGFQSNGVKKKKIAESIIWKTILGNKSIQKELIGISNKQLKEIWLSSK